MKHHIRKLSQLAFAVAVSFGGTAYAGEDVGAFSFAYSFERDRSITPFQVFDDGRSTFLQYRDRSRIPTFLIKEGSGTRVLVPQEDGPYLRLDAVAARIELVSADGRNAAIVSNRKTTKQAAPVATAPQSVQRDKASDEGQSPVIATRTEQPQIAYAPAPNRQVQTPPAPTFSNVAPPPASPLQVAAPPQQNTQVESLRQQLSQMTQLLIALKSQLDELAGDSPKAAPMSNPALYPQRAPAQYPRPAVESAGFQSTGIMKQAAYTQAEPTVKLASLGAIPPTADAVPVSYTPPVGAPVVFQVADGQRLSDAVRRFVSNQNLVLDWDTGGADYEIRFGYTISGASVDAVLLTVLTPFKFNAITRRGNGVVAVTRAS